MVPAEFMTSAVAMFADALPQLPYFGNELFTCHLVKVGVHGNPLHLMPELSVEEANAGRTSL
jgi:hypothetical protein